MPRMRPLRTKEEVAQVPPDKPVTIELKEEETSNEPNPFEEPEVKAKEQPAGTLPKKSDPQPEDDTADLKKQLEDMRKAKEASERRMQEAERTHKQALEAARLEAERQVSSSRIQLEDAEYGAIISAIGKAQAEAESAERDIAIASEAGNHQAVAEANRRLARAESRMAQLEDGKDAIERAKSADAAKAKAEADRPAQPKQQPSVGEYIDSLPNLLPSQRDWLKSHPETLSDNRLNMRLQGAHVEAEDQGLRPGSQKYFDYLETRLGYKKVEEEEEEEEAPPAARMPIAAPPSRAAHNPSTGKQSSTRITLDEHMREAAKISGVDEITYAKMLQRMNKMKADGTLN